MTACPARPDATAGFVAALLDASLAAPGDLKVWNGSDPARRFAVHRNNLKSSLVAVLAAAFPVTQALVGEPFFQAMAASWVSRSPPVSPVLAEYGGGFPGYIAGFAPADALPFLSDVARLEWLRNVSFHAADAPTLDAEDYRPWLLVPGQLDGLRLRLHPACRWLRSAYPVRSIWLAHHGQGALAAIEPDRGEDVLLIRPVHEVQVVELPAGGAEFLDALQRGRALGEAAAEAGEYPGFDLAQNLRCLVEHRLACATLDTSSSAL